MKRLLIAVCICLLVNALFPQGAHAAAPPDDLVSRAVVLIDAETGQVLYQRNMYAVMAPASVTKIITALLVVECADPDEVVLVTASALDIDEPESTNIELAPGEEMTVADALYALMLASANDVANVLAEYIMGTQGAFAELMTRRAQELGAHSSHFANPHGLDQEGHYTTAYDLALITRAAIQNEAFLRYFGTAEHTIPATNLHASRALHNYHLMLLPSQDQYDETVLGGKVGFTDDAQHTMSTVAVRDGRTLICVVLNSPYYLDKYADTAALFDFGFGSFSPCLFTQDELPAFSVPISGAGTADFRSGEVTLWLPEGCAKEDVRLSYSHPKAFAEAADAACTLQFSLDGTDDWLPEVLLEIPMEVQVTEDALAVASLQWTAVEKTAPMGGDALQKGALLLLGVMGLLVLVRSRHADRART